MQLQVLRDDAPVKSGPPQQAIRVGDWKAIRRDIFKGNMQIELYNLAEDITEQHDLAIEHPEVVDRLSQLIEDARIPSETFPLFETDKR